MLRKRSQKSILKKRRERNMWKWFPLVERKIWLKFFKVYVLHRLTLNVLLYYVCDLHTASRCVVCGFLQYVASSNALFILPLRLEFKCVSKRININCRDVIVAVRSRSTNSVMLVLGGGACAESIEQSAMVALQTVWKWCQFRGINIRPSNLWLWLYCGVPLVNNLHNPDLVFGLFLDPFSQSQ
jgi:hypothetical protein